MSKAGTDESDRRCTRPVLGCDERATNGGRHAEGRQQRVRCEKSAGWRYGAADARGVVPDSERADGLERSPLVAEVDEVGVGCSREAGPRSNGDDATWVAETGGVAKELCVDDAEQRDDGRHADREREHDGGGEPGGAHESPHDAAQVQSERVSRCSSSRLPHGNTTRERRSKSRHSLPSGLSFRAEPRSGGVEESLACGVEGPLPVRSRFLDSAPDGAPLGMTTSIRAHRLHGVDRRRLTRR